MFNFNIFSGKTYYGTEDLKVSQDGNTFTKLGNSWFGSNGDIVQKMGDNWTNLNTGVSSSWGDPWEQK
jgi:hypothetical protein